MISSEFKTHSCQHQNLPILQTFLNAILLAPGTRRCWKCWAGCPLTGVEGVEPVSQVRCWGALGTSIGISLPWTHVQQYQRQSAWLAGLKCFFGQLPRTTWNRARLCKSLIVSSLHIKMITGQVVQRGHGSTSNYLFWDGLCANVCQSNHMLQPLPTQMV